MAAAIGGDARRFTPFPSHLEVKWKDQNGNEVTKRFQEKPGDPIVSDLSLLRTLIGQMPSVKEMAKWKTTQELKVHQYSSSVSFLTLALELPRSN